MHTTIACLHEQPPCSSAEDQHQYNPACYGLRLELTWLAYLQRSELENAVTTLLLYSVLHAFQVKCPHPYSVTVGP